MKYHFVFGQCIGYSKLSVHEASLPSLLPLAKPPLYFGCISLKPSPGNQGSEAPTPNITLLAVRRGRVPSQHLPIVNNRKTNQVFIIRCSSLKRPSKTLHPKVVLELFLGELLEPFCIYFLIRKIIHSLLIQLNKTWHS